MHEDCRRVGVRPPEPDRRSGQRDREDRQRPCAGQVEEPEVTRGIHTAGDVGEDAEGHGRNRCESCG